MANQVICEHPRFILNPQLPELLARFNHFYLNGRSGYMRNSSRCLFYFDKSQFGKYLPLINHDTIDDYFVVDDVSGQSFPIFLEVPCGQCGVCKDRKVRSFVQRCRLESQCYDYKPLFITLTYDNEHLPDCGLCVRDVQLFLKRLRINLSRSGYKDPIRYCIVGEYGSHTHRAHYHGLIWNLHATDGFGYKSLIEIVQNSWNNGESRRPRLVDPSEVKTFFYTAKYLRKDCDVPKGKNDTFMVSSRGNGGIGAHFLDSLRESYVKKYVGQFCFFDKWRNRNFRLNIDQYVLNRLLPSFCRSVPSEFRKAVRYVKYFSKVVPENLKAQVTCVSSWIDNNLRDRVFVPTFNVRDSILLNVHELKEHLKVMFKYMKKITDVGLFFNRAMLLDEKRQYYLSRMFMYAEPADIASMAFSCRRRALRSRALEQL